MPTPLPAPTTVPIFQGNIDVTTLPAEVTELQSYISSDMIDVPHTTPGVGVQVFGEEIPEKVAFEICKYPLCGSW